MVKETPVLGGFDKANYVTERRWATAEDGVRVPFTLLWRQGLARLDGSDPCLLYGCAHPACALACPCQLPARPAGGLRVHPGA